MNSIILNAVYGLIEDNKLGDYYVVPLEYIGPEPTNPFLRLSITGGSSERNGFSDENRRKLDGIIQIQIVTDYGRGLADAAEIVDILNPLLEEKFIVSTVQTKLGTAQVVGRDPEDSTKLISEYSLPFTYIGE